MCGIAGLWSPTRYSSETEAHAHKMADRLYHRGPDGRGFHFDAANGLAMIHTRLSIIGLSAGDQPLYGRKEDGTGSLVGTINGEFYDYKRLRGLLRTDGYEFNTKSDSEIALKLYDKHGLDFVEHLRGEFAFAIFDEAKQQLILVRDRFGIRPLFYHHGEAGFFWGSEMKAMLAHPDVPRDMCPKAQLHQMMQVMVPGMTLFEGIHAIKPGHMLIVTRKGDEFEVEERRYWDAEFPLEGQHDEFPDEVHIENVRQALVESITFRLEADVPVACYLSGGIDSCSIIGMAAAIQQSPVKAFTISFDDARYDEAAIATEMAEKAGADQDILTVKALDLYGKNFEDAIYYSERTFYNTLGVAKMLMSKHVREVGYKVVITGEGSDELFGGYAQFKADLFLHDPEYAKTPAAEEMRKRNAIFSGSVLAETAISHPAFEEVMGFTPNWIQPWMLTLERVKPLLSDEFKAKLGDYDPIAAIAYSLDKSMLDGRHVLDKVQYSWIKTMLEGQILNWGGDRVDMANSLESRPAFLDHHVAELAMRIPPHVRVRDGIEKWVVREAMKHVLPEVLYKREKFAFMAPPAHTDKAKAAEIDKLIAKWLSSERIAKYGIFDEAKMKASIEEYRKSDDHAANTRKDIILNHAIALHAIEDLIAA
ncbi:asparagine synthase (glutamine-hydrolyzing) [Novosphingobium mangrovi (ex Huang et al. 2023)]|uniref:asparagine synthase (glutamine-hydrolyzing) n=1 Tax=Novosphingobium mangrovi (ex Huang et al. 2023) TaxID=2976432 RepID=A0ABT2I544_9SPHN|nr:asparagine synthase (glutamine-hydrolyzing) [Novosphingobium mangrovi (ex Huang et al. 2023)]MCT2399936.1 asparagine synthase (glutamine-hydrolyzing) [Novosphingobium mangrovi (ex Huang et al. 2023)]